MAHFSDYGLAELDSPENVTLASGRSFRAKLSGELRDWIKLTEQAVSAVLNGRQPRLLPPLDLRAGTDFQQRVWAALREICLGETKSYSEVAAAIGSPKALRAVGGACGANPIPLVIPCHRVVASGGKLGGFSGGLDWKKRLLAIEGVLTQRSQVIDPQRMLFDVTRPLNFPTPIDDDGVKIPITHFPQLH
jgi:O-6-methylguanine DNA methyltransferase